MYTSFYKKQRLLPFIMHPNGHKEYQHEILRPQGMPECAQFSICTCGEGKFTTEDDKVYRVKKGDVFYFLPDVPHSYKNVTDKWSINYLLISGQQITSFLQHLGYQKSGVLRPDADTYNNLLDMWKYVGEHHKEFSDSTLIARLSAECYKMLIGLRQFLPNAVSERREREYQKLIPVLSAIESQFSSDLTLNYLAGIISITPTYLCRLFKNVFGISPVIYIKNVRMEKAKTLLREEKLMPISSIANQCGFADSSYFGKVFKKSFGITPEYFRTTTTYGKDIS